MNLTVEQERRLRVGDYSPLFFPYDKDGGQPVEPPYKLVLDWDDGYRTADALGNVTVVPPQPVRWIVVTSVKRETRSGGWLVRFNTEDRREHHEYLGPGGTYTTSRFRAIDDLEVIPRKDLQRFAKQAYDRDRVIRLERTAAAQQERWRRKRQSKRVAESFRRAA